MNRGGITSACTWQLGLLLGCSCRALWLVDLATILQRPAVLQLDAFRRYRLGCK